MLVIEVIALKWRAQSGTTGSNPAGTAWSHRSLTAKSISRCSSHQVEIFAACLPTALVHKRIAPPQPGELCEVPIGCVEFNPRLDRQRLGDVVKRQALRSQIGTLSDECGCLGWSAVDIACSPRRSASFTASFRLSSCFRRSASSLALTSSPGVRSGWYACIMLYRSWWVNAKIASRPSVLTAESHPQASTKRAWYSHARTAQAVSRKGR
jgi:hypothetical protein